MVNRNSNLPAENPGPRSRSSSLSAVPEALDRIVASAQPAVVFSSLVRLAVPIICDSATATILGPEGTVHAVSWPRKDAAWSSAGRRSVMVPFDAPETQHHAAFRGELTLAFSAPDPSQPCVAELLVDLAMATVERERLHDSLRYGQRDAATLERGLAAGGPNPLLGGDQNG